MKRTLATLATAAAMALVTSAPAVAQYDGDGGRTFRIGVAGGLAQPLGDFGDVANLGFNVTGTVDMQPSAIPFGIRADLMYNRFGLEDVDGNASVLAGLLNAVLEFGTQQTTARPYLIGGVGLYRAAIDIDNVGDDSETAFGVGVGGGFRFPLSGFDTYAEVRYHNAFTEDESTSFIPVVFGIRF